METQTLLSGGASIAVRAALTRIFTLSLTLDKELAALKLAEIPAERVAPFANFARLNAQTWGRIARSLAGPQSLSDAGIWREIGGYVCACGMPKVRWSCFCMQCAGRLPVHLAHEIAAIETVPEKNIPDELIADVPRRYRAAMAALGFAPEGGK